MKYNRLVILLGISVLTSCTDLDMNPLSEGSSESWYSSEAEIEMSIKDLYRSVFWSQDNDEWTDDHTNRDISTPFTNATLNGETSNVKDLWTNSYKAIVRANTILVNMEKAASLGISQKVLDQYTAEARFVRAAQYANLVSHFGDVVYVAGSLDLNESFKMGRTDKQTIISEVYKDFDFAIENLPENYSSSALSRATKGAAYALKARFALYMQDWEVAASAAKSCIDLSIYKLHPSFSNLFLTSTKNSVESIFLLPRSIEFGTVVGIRGSLSRNGGGWAQYDPSWDLLCAFLCTDGLPIDESPLFDPHNPFKNRDPRCSATIVEFGTEHLGYIYDPNPKSLEVLNVATGKMQKNNDTRKNATYASFNGLVWKKGIDASCQQNSYNIDPDKVIVRYADVLLMYAEAKIELNQIDQEVVDAINQVRARAYGVAVTAKDKYPAVVIASQVPLRKIIHTERRMEFAWEGLRYMDIIRWHLAEKVLNLGSYGMLDVADLESNVANKGLWFFAKTPQIDEDGIADLEPLYKEGYAKLLTKRIFDASRQYLWPIPSKEIIINSNIKQNPGY